MSLLDDTALTIPTALYEELGLTGEPPTSRLERAVMAASARVRQMLGRGELHYAAAHTEELPARGGAVLLLGRTPVASVASVTYSTDGGSTSTAVAASDYTLEDGALGVLRHLGGGWGFSGARVGAAGDPVPGTELAVYTVTYAGGWVTPHQAAGDGSLTRDLPFDLEAAVLDLAAQAWRRRGQDLAVKSRSTLDASITYDTGAAGQIPPPVADVLSRYRRLAI